MNNETAFLSLCPYYFKKKNKIILKVDLPNGMCVYLLLHGRPGIYKQASILIRRAHMNFLVPSEIVSMVRPPFPFCDKLIMLINNNIKYNKK